MLGNQQKCTLFPVGIIATGISNCHLPKQRHSANQIIATLTVIRSLYSCVAVVVSF